MMMIALTGFGLGALATLAAILILVPLRAGQMRPGGWSKAFAGTVFALPLLIVAWLTPELPEPAQIATPMPTLPASDGSAMREGDWSLMAHMYLGGPPPAGDAAAATPVARTSATDLATATQREPDNAQAWLALANAQRQARDFAAAVKSFERALALDQRSADAWADYADALASAGNRTLAGRPATAIARALKIDPRHLKALWLQASLDLEQKRYAAALERWQQLRSALPDGSPDIRIIEANIAEARGLAGKAGSGG